MLFRSGSDFTGVTRAPTAPTSTSNTQIATTAYVTSRLGDGGTYAHSISGNAGTVTNGVYTNGSYANPSWITSLAASKVGLGNVNNTADSAKSVNYANTAGSATTAGSAPASDVYSWAKKSTKPSYNFSEIGSAAISATSAYLSSSLQINYTSPTIYLQDTDHRSSMIHCNSGTFYILRGSDSNSTSWETAASGYWPLTIDLSNNDATFGGNLTAIYNVTAYSDKKLKDKVRTIDSALQKTLALRGVYYVRYDDPDRQRMGVIAQEVQEIIPEVVLSNINPDTKEETLSVDYGNIVALLIESIKELKAEIDELKGKIK